MVATADGSSSVTDIAAGSQTRPRLSVIIIAFNEIHHIEACLASVSFADEIVVVDSGSTDGTIERARELGARVTVTDDWPGFGPQKNRALDLATGDWILSLDADERVTPELAREIQQTMAQPAFDAYAMARLSEFVGRPMRHCGWWPDHLLRLFRRGRARFSNDVVHESIQADGATGLLKHHLLHYPYPDIESLLVKMNRYSTAGAQKMHQRGKRTSVFGALGHGFWTFVRIYIMRRGFLDGRQGLVVACAGAAGSFFRYAKLIELQNKKP